MEEKEKNRPMNFKQKLLEKIKEKKEFQKKSQQFQDLHWDDTYDVYYDS